MAILNRKTMSAGLFLALCLIIETSWAQEETHCKGHEVKLTVKQKGQITECLEEAGIKSFWKIPAEKLPCLGVCILEKKEMLTADGRIDHAKALAYIDAVMTGPVKQPLMDGIDKCIKDHGDKIKMDKDPKCMTFMEVGQCVHDVFFEQYANAPLTHHFESVVAICKKLAPVWMGNTDAEHFCNRFALTNCEQRS